MADYDTPHYRPWKLTVDGENANRYNVRDRDGLLVCECVTEQDAKLIVMLANNDFEENGEQNGIHS